MESCTECKFFDEKENLNRLQCISAAKFYFGTRTEDLVKFKSWWYKQGHEQASLFAVSMWVDITTEGKNFIQSMLKGTGAEKKVAQQFKPVDIEDFYFGATKIRISRCPYKSQEPLPL